MRGAHIYIYTVLFHPICNQQFEESWLARETGIIYLNNWIVIRVVIGVDALIQPKWIAPARTVLSKDRNRGSSFD